MSMLRMHELIPPPPEVFMSLCLMKHWKTILCFTHRFEYLSHCLFEAYKVLLFHCCTRDISVRYSYTRMYSLWVYLIFDKAIDITSLIISLKLHFFVTNLATRWVAFLCIRKVLGSDLGTESRNHYWGFPRFFLILFRNGENGTWNYSKPASVHALYNS